MEILAPAGHIESVYAAVNSGADSVYLGLGSFNARRNARNFTEDDLKEAVEYCRLNNVKIYLTLNTLIFDGERDEFLELVRIGCRYGVDAFIVQDLGAFSLIKKAAPEIPVHASTQMGIHNIKGAVLLKSLGFKRIVLAREMNFNQIRDLVENVEIETEVFIHGALCMSVSGSCYLSAMLGGRSANRGACAQPCRLPFKSGAKSGGEYALSLKDLSAVEMIASLRDIGVTGVKIEGRMKRPEYTGAAVDACYKTLKGEESDLGILQSVFSRSGFTNGYLENRLHGMHGVRSRDDVLNANEVLFRKIREGYKSPVKKLDVSMNFSISENSPSCLTVKDESGNKEVIYGETAQPAEKRQLTEDDAYGALSKLGGTLYNLKRENFRFDSGGGLYFPLKAMNSMRRSAVEKLNYTRSRIQSKLYNKKEAEEDFLNLDSNFKKSKEFNLKLRAEFHRFSQIPFEKEELFNKLDKIVLPIDEILDNIKIIEKLETGIKEKLIIGLPRLIIDSYAEKELFNKLEILKKCGFKGIYTQNISHIQLGNELGMKIYGGFGLNICNRYAVAELNRINIKDICFSLEMTCNKIDNIYDLYDFEGEGICTGAVLYGRIPLMLMRTCPVKKSGMHKSCGNKNCAENYGKYPRLGDRKGKKFPINCVKAYGFTELLNADIMRLDDKIRDFKYLDFAWLLFTTESRNECAGIIEDYSNSIENSGKYSNMKKHTEGITRALYYRGVK